MRQCDNEITNNIVILERLKDKKYVINNREKKIFVIFLTDGRDQKGMINIDDRGQGAEVTVLGIILGYGKQRVELKTFQHLVGRKSNSKLFIRSVLFDQAYFNYHGLVRIGEKAQQSVAYLENQNLKVSSKSRILTRPSLEILTNDVSCNHGVTIGTLDEEQLYYLQSRGLDKKEATKLIIVGFLNEVLQKIPEEKLKLELAGKLETQIEKLCLT